MVADTDADTDVWSSRMMADTDTDTDTDTAAATVLVLKARGERQRHFRIHGLIFFGTDA